MINYVQPADFPPIFFFESAADIYLPKAAQLSCLGWDLGNFLESIGEEVAPFVFYEAGPCERESVEACLSGFVSGRLNNVILGLPATSATAMREALKKYKDRTPSGFRAVFIDASRLKFVG